MYKLWVLSSQFGSHLWTLMTRVYRTRIPAILVISYCLRLVRLLRRLLFRLYHRLTKVLLSRGIRYRVYQGLLQMLFRLRRSLFRIHDIRLPYRLLQAQIRRSAKFVRLRVHPRRNRDLFVMLWVYFVTVFYDQRRRSTAEALQNAVQGWFEDNILDIRKCVASMDWAPTTHRVHVHVAVHFFAMHRLSFFRRYFTRC